MIKFVIAAIWISLATLGAVFFSFQSAGAKVDAAAADGAKTMMGGLDYVKTEVISVPLISKAKIDGYFLARLVYTVDPAELKKLTVPAESVITDIVYSYIYSNPDLNFANTAALDLDAFRAGVRTAINERVKYDLVKDVLVEQLDYLSKDDIRDNALRRRSTATKVPTLPDAGHPEPAAEGGHGGEPKPAH